MILHSSVDNSIKVTLAQGAKHGVAQDGGVYLPDSLPKLPNAFLNNLPGMQLGEVAFVIANTLFGDELPSVQIKKVVDSVAQDSSEFEARFFAGMLPELAPVTPKRTRLILCATGGSDFSPISRAFAPDDDTRVVAIFPKGMFLPKIAGELRPSNKPLLIEVDGTGKQCLELANEAVRLSIAGSEDSGVCMTLGTMSHPLRRIAAVIRCFADYARLQKISLPMHTGLLSYEQMSPMYNPVVEAHAMGLPECPSFPAHIPSEHRLSDITSRKRSVLTSGDVRRIPPTLAALMRVISSY